MIIHFIDGDPKIVGDSKGELVKRALDNGVEYIDLDGDYIRASTITRVVGVKDTGVAKKELPVGANELTDEQRERSLKRIQEMREKFFKRKG